MERRGQNSQGPQDLRNNTVVSSLDFIFASSIQNLEWKKPATQDTNWCRPEKSQQKPVLCSQRTEKAAA